jgi:hypothetical protein
MIDFYKIELYEIERNLLGYINFNLNTTNNKINVSYIHINQPGKKYGTFLLIIFMCYVINFVEQSLISGIYLDDCSDLSSTKQSIYYKFGMRLLNQSKEEELGIKFLKSLSRSIKPSTSSDLSTAEDINFNTFIHYYNSLIKHYNEIIEQYTKINKFFFVVYTIDVKENTQKQILIQNPDICMREIPEFERTTRQRH